MAMMAQEWSINGLSVEFGVDRRTVAKRLQDVTPCRQDDRTSYYLMRDVAALVGSAQSDSGDTLDLNVERARLAKEQADKCEMENEEKRGRLIDAEKVSVWWVQIITNAKSKLLAVPTKAAPLVLGCKNLAQAKDILEKLIHDTLSELSATNPVSITGGESVAGVETAAETDGEPVGRPRKKAKPRE